ncbi:50S ribosomal protein L9 [Chloroflexota bacterium]
MKVIFLQDVPNVARAGEIKDVANGYGRNFLLPQKLVSLASPQEFDRLEAEHRKKTRSQAQTEVELAELARRLDGKEISLKTKVGGKDRLYGSVTSADIAAELRDTMGVEIDKRKIELTEPIRHLGSYEVTIRLAKDVMPKINVAIVKKEES